MISTQGDNLPCSNNLPALVSAFLLGRFVPKRAFNLFRRLSYHRESLAVGSDFIITIFVSQAQYLRSS